VPNLNSDEARKLHVLRTLKRLALEGVHSAGPDGTPEGMVTFDVVPHVMFWLEIQPSLDSSVDFKAAVKEICLSGLICKVPCDKVFLDERYPVGPLLALQPPYLSEPAELPAFRYVRADGDVITLAWHRIRATAGRHAARSLAFRGLPPRFLRGTDDRSLVGFSLTERGWAKLDTPTEDQADGQGAPAESSDTPPRAQKAYSQYQHGAGVLGKADPTDREVYDLLLRSYEQAGEGDDLPSFATWQRNLREYRRLTGTQKNTSRAGRAEAARCFVKVEDIEPESLPHHVRPRSAGK